MATILSKFTVLYRSYFIVYLLKWKLILFYDRVVYCYIRLFLILLPYPVHKALQPRYEMDRLFVTRKGRKKRTYQHWKFSRCRESRRKQRAINYNNHKLHPLHSKVTFTGPYQYNITLLLQTRRIPSWRIAQFEPVVKSHSSHSSQNEEVFINRNCPNGPALVVDRQAW